MQWRSPPWGGAVIPEFNEKVFHEGEQLNPEVREPVQQPQGLLHYPAHKRYFRQLCDPFFLPRPHVKGWVGKKIKLVAYKWPPFYWSHVISLFGLSKRSKALSAICASADITSPQYPALLLFCQKWSKMWSINAPLPPHHLDLLTPATCDCERSNTSCPIPVGNWFDIPIFARVLRYRAFILVPCYQRNSADKARVLISKNEKT